LPPLLFHIQTVEVDKSTGAGNRPPNKKKMSNPRGMSGGMVTGGIEPRIKAMSYTKKHSASTSAQVLKKH